MYKKKKSNTHTPAWNAFQMIPKSVPTGLSFPEYDQYVMINVPNKNGDDILKINWRAVNLIVILIKQILRVYIIQNINRMDIN